jgi:predicted transcriptional regulator of viral defense system
METATHRARALEVARRRGIARGRDFDAAGVTRATLQRLRDEGVLQRVGRGLYKLATSDADSATSLAEAVRIQPRGVICLLSALQFHELTTQTPHAVWLMLGQKDWAPINPSVALKVVRASGAALTEGVEAHMIDGVSVPITSPAKTVADCFKHRNKIGVDVAVEALRDFMKSQGRRDLNEIYHYAQVDRVQSVMRPYLEAMT